MSGQLQLADGGGATRCTFCSADAVGPCASCRKPVCGDCCTLTEGGAKAWAVCLDCDRKQGRSLRRAWLGVALFVAAILGGLAALVALAGWLASRGGR